MFIGKTVQTLLQLVGVKLTPTLTPIGYHAMCKNSTLSKTQESGKNKNKIRKRKKTFIVACRTQTPFLLNHPFKIHRFFIDFNTQKIGKRLLFIIVLFIYQLLDCCSAV